MKNSIKNRDLKADRPVANSVDPIELLQLFSDHSDFQLRGNYDEINEYFLLLINMLIFKILFQEVHV